MIFIHSFILIKLVFVSLIFFLLLFRKPADRRVVVLLIINKKVFFTFYANSNFFVFAEKWNLWSIIAMALFFVFISFSAFLNIGHEEMLLIISCSGQITTQKKKKSLLKSTEFSEIHCFFHLHFMLWSLSF